MNKLLLIDWDSCLYLACEKFKVDTTFDDVRHLWHADEDDVKEDLETTIKTYLAQLGASEYLLVLSDTCNFRKLDVLDTYKENRKDKPKPLSYYDLYDYYIETKQAIVWPKLEADDVLGILSTDKTFKPGMKKIIVAEDKDLRTIPGWLWNPIYKKKREYKNLIEELNQNKFATSKSLIAQNKLLKFTQEQEISREEADINFYRQALMGDDGDGFKGCKGIASVKSKKILSEKVLEGYKTKEDSGGFDDAVVWDFIILPEYKKQGHTGEYALAQARCARILRVEDWDSDKQEVILWNPK